MTGQQENMGQTPESARADAARGVTAGAALRAAREAMGMSVDEVAGRLKFAPRQIVALEEGNFDQIPAGAFLRGFVRSYAKLVQMDDAPLIAALPSAPAHSVLGQGALPERQGARKSMPSGSAALNQNMLWVGGVVGLLVIGILVFWHEGSQPPQKPVAEVKAPEAPAAAQTAPVTEASPALPATPVEVGAMGQSRPADESGPEAQPKTMAEPRLAEAGKPRERIPAGEKTPGDKNQPGANMKPGENMKPAPKARPKMRAAASAPASTAPVSGAGIEAGTGVAAAQTPAREGAPKQTVRFEFDQDSWVEVKDADGRVLMSVLGLQGGKKSVSGSPPLSVTIGNAPGVRVYYRGEPVDLGQQGVAHLNLE